MKKILGITSLLGVLLLAACSSISAGYITSKEHHDSYMYMTMSCAAYSSKGICTSWIQIWHTMPERWVLNLQDNGKDGWVDVDPSTYDKYEVGDYFGRPVSAPD